MIEAAQLSKRYRKKTAVTNLSFTVETGKVTGFLGPNGAGKSTTMRLMLGLDSGQGATTFDGKALAQYAQPSSMVGILLEAKAFHPTRSARQHLQILADAGGVPAGRVQAVLETVGLSDVAKKKPGKFSLGMSQRLGIAAAILGQPKYLLLDEPANGLDPEGIAWLRQFIKDYADAGNAVFVSSHLLSEMSQMADNVVVIGKGKLIAATSMKQLVANSTHSGVFVRTDNTAKFQTALHKAKLDFTNLDAGLQVAAKQTDQVGKLAFTAGVTVLELRPQEASLEEAFLELTASSQEYKTGKTAMMRGLIKAEARKLLTTRSTYAILTICLVLEAIITFYAKGIKISSAGLTDPSYLANDIVTTINVLVILVALICTLLVTNEYRYNTILYTLTAAKTRSHALAAKWIVVSVFALAVTALFAVIAPLLTTLGVAAGGHSLAAQHLNLASVVGRSLFAGWAFVMISVAIATIIRVQVGAIAALFIIPSTIEQLLTLVLKDNNAYLPYMSVNAVLTKASVSYTTAAVTALVWVAILWLLAWQLFIRRDAN